jgi:WD40 repeat protein
MSPQKHSPQQAAVERTTARPIRILHLSDPQYGRFHRFGKSSGTPGDKSFDRLVSRIFDDLETFLEPLPPTKTGSKSQLLDLVVVSGDLTEWATKPEFVELAEEMRWLAERLDLPLSRFVFVPGNHDVNRRKSKEYFDECAENRVAPVSPFVPKWAPYNEFFADFYRGVEDPPTFSGDQPWTWYEFAELGLVLAGVNSTMAENHLDDSHFGFVGEQQYRWFSDRFEESSASWKLAVLHHNIIRLSTGNDDPLTDSNDFIRYLGPHTAVVLHGHLHNQKMDRLPTGTLVLAAGSAAHLPVKLDPIPLDWDVANDYQVLELLPGKATQMARRYDGSAKRWVGDTRISGNEWKLDHELPNGPVLEARETDQDTSDLYEQMFRWQDENPYSNVSEIFLKRSPNAFQQKHNLQSRSWALAQEVADIEQLRAETAGGRISVRYEDHDGYAVVRLTGTGGSRVIGVTEEFSSESITRFAEEIVQPRRSISGASRFDFVHGGCRESQAIIDDWDAKLGVQLRSYRSYIDLVDLTAFESKQLAWLALRKEYDPELYVEHRVRPSKPGLEDSQETLAGVPYLMESAKQITVILADSGAGKTFLLRQLCASLSSVKREDRRVPIFVELAKRDKAQDLVGLVLSAFNDRRVDVTRSVVEHLLQHDRLFIILDGYDELAIRTSFGDAARAVSSIISGVPEAHFPPVVLSSRRQHVEHDGALITPLGTQPSRLAFIEPFDEAQILEALARLLQQSSGGVGDSQTRSYWADEAQKLNRVLDQLPNLGELASNPRLLSFLYELRIDLAEIAENPSKRSSFNRSTAYRMVTDRWLKQDRELRSDQIGEVSPEVAKRCIRRVALIAWTLQNELQMEHFSASVIGEAVRGWEPSQLARWISDRTFFSRVEGSYSFMHRSTLEYILSEMAADAVNGSLQAELQFELAKTFQAVVPSTLFGDLLKELADGFPDSDESLNALLATWEIENPLPQLRSKLGLTRADSFVNLTRTNEDLSEENWENTVHSNCNYRGSILPKRMRCVRFVNCNLDSTDATEADLRDATFEGGSIRRLNALNSGASGATVDAADASFARLLWNDGPKRTELRGIGYSTIDSPFSLESWPPNPHFLLLGDGPVLSWSRGGTVLAVRSTRQVTIWDTETWALTKTIHTLEKDFECFALSPNGKTLATCHQGQVFLWQTTTGGHLRRIVGNGQLIHSIAWSADGTTLATGTEDGRVILFEAATGIETTTLYGHDGPVTSAAWSSDGQLLATGQRHGRIHLWSATGEPVDDFEFADDFVGLAWTPDRPKLAIASRSKVAVWDTRTEGFTITLKDFDSQIHCVAWAPDGLTLATGAEFEAVIWDASTGAEKSRLTYDQSEFFKVRKKVFKDVGWSPDSKSIVTSGIHNPVTLWDARNGTVIAPVVHNRQNQIQSAHWSRDGQYLATLADGNLGIWSTANGAESVWQPPKEQISAFAWSPDGTVFAIAGSSNRVSLWDTQTREVLAKFKGRPEAISHIEWSPNGLTLAIAVHKSQIDLVSSGDGERVGLLFSDRMLRGSATKTPKISDHLFRHMQRLNFAWSSDGKLIRTVDSEGRAVELSVATGEVLREFLTEGTKRAAWSPDGTILAVGGFYSQVTLWNPKTGAKTRTLGPDSTGPSSLSWSRDSTTLAVGGHNGQTTLWNAATGAKDRKRLARHNGPVYSVAWSSDGMRLASCSTIVAIDDLTSSALAETDQQTLFLASSKDGSSVVHKRGDTFQYKTSGECQAIWFANGLCRFELTETDALAALGIHPIPEMFSIT